MKKFFCASALALLVLTGLAAGTPNGLRIQSGNSSTNATTAQVTVTGTGTNKTDVNAGGLLATNWVKVLSATASKPARVGADQTLTNGVIDINSSDVTGILPKANGGTGADNSSVTFPSSGTITISTDWNTVTKIETATGANIITSTEIDSVAELEALTGVNLLVSTELDTSAELSALLTDETGSGSAVFGTSPTLTTPTINGGNTTPIALGSGTSFALDPNYRVYTATASGNVTINLATNSVAAGVALRTPIYLYLYDGTGSRTITRSSSGTGGTAFTGGETCFGWGTNSATAGTNVYILDWDGAIWHFDQLSAQISAAQIGNGSVSDIEFARLDGLSGTITTDTSTTTFTGKTFDASASGNVLKFADYKDFVFPARVDGTGCIIGSTNTANVLGLASYSGSADTNGNYAIFRIGTVPYDLDTSVAMTLKGLSVRVDGSDTDAAEFTIALYSPASSAAGMPSDFTACSTFINFDTGSLTSPAAGDTFFCSDVTLTGWAAALTAGRPFIIAIARRNGLNDDIVSITAGTISYGRTQ